MTRINPLGVRPDDWHNRFTGDDAVEQTITPNTAPPDFHFFMSLEMKHRLEKIQSRGFISRWLHEIGYWCRVGWRRGVYWTLRVWRNIR